MMSLSRSRQLAYQCSVFILAISICLNANALSTGEQLPPLHIASTPVDFNYKADGKHQVILIYPLELSSTKIKQFHHQIIKQGFCPKSIVDMNKRAWYVPLAMAETELQKEVKNSPNPKCTVTADYNNTTSKHWQIKTSPATIVVDGEGRIVFFANDILNTQQQNEVLRLLKKDVNKVIAATAQETTL